MVPTEPVPRGLGLGSGPLARQMIGHSVHAWPLDGAGHTSSDDSNGRPQGAFAPCQSTSAASMLSPMI